MEKTAQQNQPPHKKTLKGQPFSPAGGGLMQPIINEKGQVMVYIRMTDVTNDSLNGLATLGAEIVHVAVDYKTVTAFVYPEQMADLKNLEQVLNVQKAIKPLTNKNSNPLELKGTDKP